MKHAFDADIATQYGLYEAILFESMAACVQNSKIFHDGKYWCFGSVKALSGAYPYMGASAIQRTLKSLEQAGLVMSANYNTTRFNRTKWYTLTNLGESLLTEEQQPVPVEQESRSAPDESNANTDNSIMEEFFTRVWSAYPKKKGKGSMSRTKVQTLMKKVGAEQLLRCIDRYLEARQWHKGDEMTYLKDGSTFFNSGYVDYLDANYEEQETITYADEDKPKRQ